MLLQILEGVHGLAAGSRLRVFWTNGARLSRLYLRGFLTRPGLYCSGYKAVVEGEFYREFFRPLKLGKHPSAAALGSGRFLGAEVLDLVYNG